MDKMKLSAPWYIYYQKLNKLFGEDPEIHVVMDEDQMAVKLYVENSDKAEAIRELLPDQMRFGNVTLDVAVIPANQLESEKMETIRRAFDGNPIISDMQSIQTPIGEVNYVVFVNKVVQYYMDNMGDINGNCSTLYQEIAKDILGTDGSVFFCTAHNGDAV